MLASSLSQLIKLRLFVGGKCFKPRCGADVQPVKGRRTRLLRSDRSGVKAVARSGRRRRRRASERASGRALAGQSLNFTRKTRKLYLLLFFFFFFFCLFYNINSTQSNYREESPPNRLSSPANSRARPFSVLSCSLGPWLPCTLGVSAQTSSAEMLL